MAVGGMLWAADTIRSADVNAVEVQRIRQKAAPSVIPDDGIDWSAERERCKADFWYWASNYGWVWDAKARKSTPFVAWPAQRELIDSVLRGEWTIGCKARRNGFTAAIMHPIYWLSAFRDRHSTIMVSQDMDTAQDLIRWLKDIHTAQPIGLRQALTIDNTAHIAWPNGSSVRAKPGNERAGRSLACDLLFVDEARNVEQLDDVLAAAEATLETSAIGASVIVSTGKPGSAFHRLWKESGEETSRYPRRMFFGWQARPDRTKEWYDKTREQNRTRLTAWLAEYPSTAEEAFATAEGRVLLFDASRHIVDCDRPTGALLYRSIDFGFSEQHPTVCVWAWHDPQAPASLTFEPDCVRLEVSPEIDGKYADGFEQLQAYVRHDETGKPVKMHDDFADSLRYLVTSSMLTGHVHVYRVLFVRTHSYSETNMLTVAGWVREMSGWRKDEFHPNAWHNAHAEKYQLSVADKGGMVSVLNGTNGEFGPPMDFVPYTPFKGDGGEGTIEAGVAWLNALLAGAEPFSATGDVPASKIYEQRITHPTNWQDATNMQFCVRRARDDIFKKRRSVA